jgi:polysaccharide pyruvyl transferase CsaB
MPRNLIVVSGYYGFDNLGDEAILEELINELCRVGSREQIVILSNNPESTTQKFGVASANRWQLSDIAPLMSRAKLFISGGGGLFQDSSSATSVIYYAGLICMAKSLGCKIMIYAQGLGPLKRATSRFVTRTALALADRISLRDDKSMSMLNGWGLPGVLTEDPVWLLKPGKLPDTTAQQISHLKKEHGRLIGLSLREGAGFSRAHQTELAFCLDKALPANAAVVALPLQKQHDQSALDNFAQDFLALGRRCHTLTSDDLVLPSQWLSLIGSLDMVVGMRLHSLIMALSAGVPVVGIAYDPKVTRVLNELDQPNLSYLKDENLISEDRKKEWLETMTKALKESASNKKKAVQGAQRCKEMACQNAEIIATMLA